MPYIQLDGQQYPLLAGDNPVGSGAMARIRLAGRGADSVDAVLRMAGDGSAVLTRVPNGAQQIRVNGVVLGAEPIPLIHGDKIEIAGHELFYGDDRRAGNTQYVPSVRVPEGAVVQPATSPKPTAAPGGRLVSLVDGRDYNIPAHGLVIGRDPTCDVVVPSGDVSRKHAILAPGPEGYLLTDTSTNGLLVNGEPISAPTLLGRGDVIRVGEEEFRFYADAAPAPRPVLATLEAVSSGVLKGQRFEVRSALTHVGRGAHNDIIVADESVSDTHAKIQRRDTGWWVVDMASTNGTYVGGRRIAGEEHLVGAPDLRFGGVKFIFRGVGAVEAAANIGGGTRAIAALRPEAGGTPREVPAAAPTPIRPGAFEQAAEPVKSPEARGVPVLVWVLVLVLVGAGVLFLLTSR